MADKTDQKTLELLAEVKRRKEEIADAERPNFKTNLSFRYHPDSNHINLRVLKDLQKILSIASFLIGQRDHYERAAAMFGVEAPPCEWENFSVDDWLADLSTLANRCVLNKKRDQLKKMEARLDKIISPEKRRELELEAIEKELNS